MNEAKTRICRLPEETFDFLGYTFGRQYERRAGQWYLGPKPSKKTIGRLCAEMSAVTDPRTTWRDAYEVVDQLNRKLRGWSNYFCVGTVVHAYEVVMGHGRRRLRRWLCKKHKVRRGAYARFPNEYLHGVLGLYRPPRSTRGLSWANS